MWAYPGWQKLFWHGFLFLSQVFFMSSLYSDSLRRSWLRPTAEDVLGFGRHRKCPLHARKTAGTQGNMGQKL